ncbi:MAG TPA: homoserine dehydrogenase [Chthoniobacterales bacterium]
MTQLGIGLAGLGNVGAGVFKHLALNRLLLRERVGVEFVIRRVAVRNLAKPREVEVPAELLTTNWRDLIDDPEIAVVVELIGGIDIAFDFVMAAINARKIVVTGNKALLAERGEAIFNAATAKRVPIFYEAAVAGGIPIIKTIREAFVGNHIRSIHGIINGTSNYILTRMADAGLDFPEALAEAQKLGYAEADPALDINGWDAAHKAIILASLAYGFWVSTDQIFVDGIERIMAADIQFAAELGYTIKLLGVIKSDDDANIEVRVHPTLIPKSHVLASVKGAFNAIAVRGDVVGDTLFYGRGAGQDPTTSSVISDLAEAAVAVQAPPNFFGFRPHSLYGTCKHITAVVSSFYLRLQVEDRPGVLAQVAGILGNHEIGISSVIQPETPEGSGSVPLVLMVHLAPEGRMRTALVEIETLDCVKAPPVMMHVETFS